MQQLIEVAAWCDKQFRILVLTKYDMNMQALYNGVFICEDGIMLCKLLNGDCTKIVLILRGLTRNLVINSFSSNEPEIVNSKFRGSETSKLRINLSWKAGRIICRTLWQ